jgi:hypothetical protein
VPSVQARLQGPASKKRIIGRLCSHYNRQGLTECKQKLAIKGEFRSRDWRRVTDFSQEAAEKAEKKVRNAEH